MDLPQAVCAYIRNGSKVLGVNRVRKTGVKNDWNLPGGKVNIGESTKHAIVREVYEETGLVVADPAYLISRNAGNDADPDVTVFECITYHVIPVAGELRESAEGPVEWVTWEQLLAPHCRFRDYNQKLYERVVATAL